MRYLPRGKTFDEFQVGERFVTASRTVTVADVVAFAGLSGDFNPIHVDEEFARNSPLKGRIAHGPLILSIASGLANQLGVFEGTTIALMGMTSRFTNPVRFDDTIRAELRVAGKKESKKGDRGIITLAVSVLNQRDEPVIEGEWVVMLTKHRPMQPGEA